MRTLNHVFIILVISLVQFATFANADEKAQWEQRKAETVQNPNLLRYYVFEEGWGEEVRNLAKSEPGKMAMSGGPQGSLYILRNNPYGVDRRSYMFKDDKGVPSPEWTEGRWPWKSALTNGLESRCVFRSGFSGEGLDSFCFEAWIRVHNTPGKNPGSSLFNIGNGQGYGLRASCGAGRVEFRVGSESGPKVLSAPLSEGVWHNLVFGLGDGKIKLFVDGKIVSSQPFDGKYVPPKNTEKPFIENRGEFLQIGGKPLSTSGEGRFDMDEMAIFKGMLSDEEVERRYLSGKPAASGQEQLAALEKLKERTARLDKISISIPRETWGYFPCGTEIPVTVTVPKESVEGGKCAVELVLTDLKGKELWKKNHLLSLDGQDSAVWKSGYKPELNGIYFLDAVIKDASGKILKRLPEKYCIGVASPIPTVADASTGNPMGLQAALDPWCFGMPYYRQFIWGTGLVAQNRELLESFKKAGRPCFPIYTLYFDHVRYKTIGEKEEKEIRAYVTEAAEGLKDVARYWEITNEPNGKFSPETYMKLLKICSEILREKSPGVPIVAPGASPSGVPFIKEIMKQGGGDYFDILSFHDYQAHPVQDERRHKTVQKLKQIVAESSSKKMPVWNSESGFFSLPRIGVKPMTGDEALRIGFTGGKQGRGQYTFTGSISTAVEESAAARQVQHILLGLASGYEKYVKCQGPSLFGMEGVNANGLPSLMGVSLSALSAVLNPMAKLEELPLSSLDDVCVTVTGRDGKKTVILFSDGSPVLHFIAVPNREYKGMDMLGNPLAWKSGPDGLLDLTLGENPVYIFDAPPDFKEATIMKMTGPARLPANNLLEGTVTVSNPFKANIKGEMSFLPLEGAKVSLAPGRVDLAPGKSVSFPFKIESERLKRREYRLQCQLKDGDKLTAASSFVFISDGPIIKVPEAPGPITLDGNDSEWKDIPADSVKDESGVVAGKPNIAEPWLPQWLGPDDLSFTVQCAWREKDGLYLLIKVRDDRVMPASPENRGLAFKWDCLELFFDGRPYGKRGGPVSAGADQVIVIPSATEQPGQCDLWYAQKDKTMVDAVFFGRKTAEGYVLEGKLTPRPGSAVKLLAGDQFCMDFLFDDTDDPKQLRKAMMALHGGAANNLDSGVWGRYQLEPLKRK